MGHAFHMGAIWSHMGWEEPIYSSALRERIFVSLTHLRICEYRQYRSRVGQLRPIV